MAELWSPDAKFAKWLEVEVAVAEALAREGIIPEWAAKKIREKARFDVARIEEIEEETRHDVIAFLTCVAEHLGEEAAYLHYGLTSSDILDTSFALLLTDAARILEEDIESLMAVIKERALEHKETVMIGRSHGIHAEPITFGLKLAVFYDEMRRNLERLKRARETVAVGKISGAVGTFANISPEVERSALHSLGLRPAPASTQIVQRDRHAEFFTCLAIIASSVEKIATEIRHLMRTEVAEVEEPFGKGQKGSSAMPHKKNPILTENVSGLARVVRANCLAAMENVALWHERDISHSSVERIIGPGSTGLLDFMLVRLTRVLEGLVVLPEKMRENLEITRGLIFSQQVLMALMGEGLSRDEAYGIVQAHALAARERGPSFKERLMHDEKVTEFLGTERVERIFDLGYHLKHVDAIFARVFGGEGG